MDDPAHRLAFFSSMTSQPRFDLVGIGDVDTGGGYASAALLNLADHVNGRPMKVVVGQLRPLLSRRDLASRQQCNMAGSAFGQVGRHDAAKGPDTTGNNVGRIGCEFGWEGLRQARARAETRDVHRAAPDGDLIFEILRENVLADPRCALRVVVGVVDVDQSAPSVDELLVADNAPEPPNRGLFDGEPFGSTYGLRVSRDHVKPRRHGVVLCEGFGEMQDCENTEMIVDFIRRGGVPIVGFGAHVKRPTVDDAGEVTLVFEVRLNQLVELLRPLGVQPVSTVNLRQCGDGLVQDYPYAVAAAAQSVGHCCPEAIAVEEDQPGPAV